MYFFLYFFLYYFFFLTHCYFGESLRKYMSFQPWPVNYSWLEKWEQTKGWENKTLILTIEGVCFDLLVKVVGRH